MVAPPENPHHVHMDPSIVPEAEHEQELPGDPRLRAAIDWGRHALVTRGCHSPAVVEEVGGSKT